MSELAPLDNAALPAGVRSRFVPDINGLRMHVLEAGFEPRGRPCVLLLHGFPELAYSWRKVMPPLAAAGFHVIAPDQRGYGRTTGWDADYDGDLRPFRILNAVRDALGLVSAFGHRSVAAVVGHDFGASVAAWCALVRPDVFRSVALMSAPFAGPPALPFDTADAAANGHAPGDDIHAALASLDRPRKHYQWYYSTRPANADMWHCPQGVHAFLRGYYHYKSADWQGNQPAPLQSWSAERVGQDADLLHHGSRQEHGRDRGAGRCRRPRRSRPAAGCPTSELAVYSAEYERTGFQGGLNWYRCRTGGALRCRTATVFRPHHRRAVTVHRRQERLGHLSAPRHFRAHAGHRLHADARLPPDRRRRPLGAAGAARTSERIATRFPVAPKLAGPCVEPLLSPHASSEILGN